MKSILDPTFRYTPSFSRDIRRSFARIRDELRRAGALRPPGASFSARVTPLPRRQALR
ncbi:MAG: hypothetical protein ABI812_01995 [Betaproteobacteria bacterium]